MLVQAIASSKATKPPRTIRGLRNSRRKKPNPRAPSSKRIRGALERSFGRLDQVLGKTVPRAGCNWAALTPGANRARMDTHQKRSLSNGSSPPWPSNMNAVWWSGV